MATKDKPNKKVHRLTAEEYLVRPFALDHHPLELGRDPAKLGTMLRRHLSHAIIHGPLPKAVRLAQLVVIRPGEKLGLPFSVLLRDDPAKSKDLLGHYAAAAYYNRQHPTSFHKRFAGNPKATFPSMLLAYCSDEKNRTQTESASNILFASLRFPSSAGVQLEVPTEVAEQIHSLNDGDCFYAELPELFKLPSLVPLFHPKRSRSSWEPYFEGPNANCSDDVVVQQANQTFRDVIHDLHRDELYLGAILPCLAAGPVLLVDPCPIISQRNGTPERDTDELGYAGLTLVFEQNYRPTTRDLNACLIVAQQLSLLWAQAGYLASRQRISAAEEATHDAYAVVRHSLGNAITWTPSEPADIRRMLGLEEITLGAVPLLSHAGLAPATKRIAWATAGPVDENLDESIRRGCFREYEAEIELDTSFVRDQAVDPRLAVLLIELARNLGKHHRRSGAALRVLPSKNRTGVVTVEVASHCDYRLLRDLRSTLHRLSDPNRARGGLDHAWLLARSLNAGNGSCSYYLGHEAGANKIEGFEWPEDGWAVRLIASTATITKLGAAERSCNIQTLVPFRICFEQLHAFESKR